MVANNLVRRTSVSQSEGSQRGENVDDCEEDRLAATDYDRESCLVSRRADIG